jgi:predicted nucleic acid-binding protein
MAFRVYVDTSVIGGCVDAEFAEDSLRLFDLVRAGRLTLLVSDVVIRELADAPPRVRQVIEELSDSAIEAVTISEEVLRLRDAYLAAGVVGPQWTDDATHVAAATVARADAIVSWNFRHIVRLDRIKAYNEVNRATGLGELTIVSPREVVYDNED